MIELGRLYRFHGQVVKARWCNGDDEWQWFDTGQELSPDEPGVFAYEDGKETLIGVINADTDELFDVHWQGTVLNIEVKGKASELTLIDDSWIDEI